MKFNMALMATTEKHPASAGPTRRPELAIVVAAQPPLFCEVLSSQLNDEPNLSVVGRASDTEHMWKVLAREKPQVLLFDFEGMGSNAEGMVHRLRRAAPRTRILALSSCANDKTAVRALEAGASGLVGKQWKFSTLVNAIQTVAQGELWANSRLTSRAFETLTGPSARKPKSELTKRELQIADGCSRGLRNKEIAKQLGISEKTVKGQLNNILRKLQVDNRPEMGLQIMGTTSPKP
jgi:DNA-binding NarL/FixJ family response regulator